MQERLRQNALFHSYHRRDYTDPNSSDANDTILPTKLTPTPIDPRPGREVGRASSGCNHLAVTLRRATEAPGCWAAAAPALIVATPLIGLSFQLDERRRIYWGAHRFGSDPTAAARFVYDGIDSFLTVGNFRPLGRFVEITEHSLALDAAEATGLAPHVAHGFMGLVMVAVLALVAHRLVAALARSAGVAPNHPVLLLYPAALGVSLVANGVGSSLVLFPVTFIGAVTFIMAVMLVTARDRDMERRPLRWHEAPTMGLLGATAATTYDLVYLAPALAAVFVATRAVAADMAPGEVLRSASVRRWAALSVGFMAVFVPVRLVIAGRCAVRACYNGSDLSISPDALAVAAGRLLTGSPPVGWINNSRLLEEFRLDLGYGDLTSNSLTALLLAAIAGVAVLAAVRSLDRSVDRSVTPADAADAGPVIAPEATITPEATSAETTITPRATMIGRRPAWLRLAMALGALGAATAALAALVAGLARVMQELRPSIYAVWRETLLSQVGWSFLIAAVVAALLGTVRASRPSAVRVIAAAAVLSVCLCTTLLANWRLAEIDRRAPLSSITNHISTATVNIDPTDGGNSRRCALIEAYSELAPSSLWISGPDVREDLDLMMLDRYGRPFCDPSLDAGQSP